MVAAQRGEFGKPALTQGDLIQPVIKEAAAPSGPLAAVPSGGIGLPFSAILIAVGVLAITGLATLRMKIANG